MKKFPPATELQFLVGYEIGQICLDPNSLQFRFAEGGQISVEYSIAHVDEQGETYSYNCEASKEGALYLHRLLQKKINTVAVEDYCLSLHFEGGAVLRIFSDEGPYESGQIYPKGRDPFIVF